MTGGGDIHILAGADEEGNRRVAVSDTPNQSAAIGGIERINADQVLPSPGQAIGGRLPSVGQGQIAGGGKVELVSRGYLDSGVGPIAAFDGEGVGALPSLEHRGIGGGRLNDLN